MAETYQALERERNTLRNRLAEAEAENAKYRRAGLPLVAQECDVCDCLFVPGGAGSETTCGACLKCRLAKVEKERDGLAVILNTINEDAKNSSSIIGFAAKVFRRLGIIREALTKLEEK